MNVYFVDDDYMTNRYHEIILEKFVFEKNISLTFFEEAEDALMKLNGLNNEEYPDYIFLDLNMPLMDGWEFLQKYYEMNLPRTKVIVLTTSENPHHVTRANGFKDLVKDYIAKPLDIRYFKKLTSSI